MYNATKCTTRASLVAAACWQEVEFQDFLNQFGGPVNKCPARPARLLARFDDGKKGIRPFRENRQTVKKA